jgi:hypothetical protein
MGPLEGKEREERAERVYKETTALTILVMKPTYVDPTSRSALMDTGPKLILVFRIVRDRSIYIAPSLRPTPMPSCHPWPHTQNCVH